MEVSWKWGDPRNRWFMRENPTKMDDDWGYPQILGDVHIGNDNPNWWLFREVEAINVVVFLFAKPRWMIRFGIFFVIFSKAIEDDRVGWNWNHTQGMMVAMKSLGFLRIDCWKPPSSFMDSCFDIPFSNQSWLMTYQPVCSDNLEVTCQNTMSRCDFPGIYEDYSCTRTLSAVAHVSGDTSLRWNTVQWSLNCTQKSGEFEGLLAFIYAYDHMYVCIYIWLVVWNICYFPIYWVSNHPNWLSYFSEGWLNHQPDIYIYISLSSSIHDLDVWVLLFLLILLFHWIWLLCFLWIRWNPHDPPGWSFATFNG